MVDSAVRLNRRNPRVLLEMYLFCYCSHCYNWIFSSQLYFHFAMIIMIIMHQLKGCSPVNSPICVIAEAPSNPLLNLPFKEELHNRFNLISEKRVKIVKHNSENLMKIGWKIRKLWHFEVSQIFKKHFLTSRYAYANEWGDDVIASQFSIHFVHRNDKNFIFQLWEC